MAEKLDSHPARLPDLGCACASLRRAARLVTQLYSKEMGWNVEPPQFSLLSALSHRPKAKQGGLGRALGLDKTTISRNLRLMQRNGWIESAPGDDRRERGYKLTSEGENILAATKPGWSRAQRKLRAALKPDEWEAMMKLLGRVAEAVMETRENDVD